VKPLADCRLYAFVDSAYLNGRSPAELAQLLVDGGADILQLRAKDWPEEDIREAAEAMLPITRAAEIPLVINDHWALASELGAEFCHLGQEDFFETDEDPTPELAFPGPQLGLSSHAPEQAEAALEEDADYIAIGPVYPTPTKPGRPGVTLDYVRWAAEHLRDCPWFAIGGLTLDNVDDVLAAGARRICVVSAILNASDPARACQQFKERLASVPLEERN
jgi:thiamine-phosphate pyrophosphorylase